jgi:thioester reductase-like protein
VTGLRAAALCLQPQAGTTELMTLHNGLEKSGLWAPVRALSDAGRERLAALATAYTHGGVWLSSRVECSPEHAQRPRGGTARRTRHFLACRA